MDRAVVYSLIVCLLTKFFISINSLTTLDTVESQNHTSVSVCSKQCESSVCIFQ